MRHFWVPLACIAVAGWLPGCMATPALKPMSVVILDAKTKRPVPGAQIQVHYPQRTPIAGSQAAVAQTDARGQASVELPETAENLKWRVSAPGYQAFSSESAEGMPRVIHLYRDKNRSEVVGSVPVAKESAWPFSVPNLFR